MQMLLLFSVLVAVTSALNSYIILTPKTIRPGEKANIAVNILSLDNINNVEAKVVASLLDYNGRVLSKTSDRFRLHEPGALQLSIPRNIYVSTQHQIRVEGKSGLLFYNTTDVHVETKYLSLLTQTDKGVYKAGQSVYIRSFGLYPNGSIYLGNISLEVIDPKGNIMRQWKDLQEPMYGVVNKTFSMDDKPVLGNWKIKASSGRMSTETTFEVSEYVLPKFNVEMVLPDYVMPYEKEITGTFSAKYTYGKEARGQLKLTVDIRWGNYQYVPQNLTNTQSMHVSGEKKFTIPLSHLICLEAYSDYITFLNIYVNAVFTEELTGKVMSKSSVILIKKDALQIDILNIGSTRYLPGFHHSIKVKFADNDGRPPTKRIGTFNISIISTDFDRNTSLVTEEVISIPTTGIIDFSFQTPNVSSNVEKLHVKVMYGTLKKTLELIPYHSANETHVKMRILSSDHKVGDQISVEIESHSNIGYLLYQLTSRGALIKNGLINFTSPNDTQLFDVPVTNEMTPKVTILVFGMDDEGRLYADQKTVSVNRILKNKVSLGFDVKQAEPGDNVTLNIQSDPLSMVHLLAIDSSSLILSKGNQITENRLMEDMKLYAPTIKDQLYFYQRDCFGHINMVYYNELYAAYRFEEADTKVMTDAANYDEANYNHHSYYDFKNLWKKMEKNCGNCCHGFGFTPAPTYAGLMTLYPHVPTYNPGSINGCDGFGFGVFIQPDQTYPSYTPYPAPVPYPGRTYQPVITPYPGSTYPPAHGKHPSKVQHIRQNFPETWLWMNQFIGANGTEAVKSKVPDSITSWVATAFSVNKQSGLGVSQQDAEINVFRPFFININIPFSVIHGEQVVLQVDVFNYMDANQTVMVTLEQNSEFSNVIENRNGSISLYSRSVKEIIKVQAGRSGTVHFPIVPEVIGKIDIYVKAQTAMAADAVKRQIRIEPEGIPKDYNIPVMVDFSTSSYIDHSVPVDFPQSVVKGSEKVHVFATGDFMVPSLKGLNRLLRLPTGCGEQTMIGFAPDVFVYDYLKETGQLTEVDAIRAINFMDRGYQRELTFQHYDGSFSIWGPSDAEGSTWLTGFVLKSFNQAKDIIHIDPDVLLKAQKWIIRRQDDSGYFRENNEVHDKFLQGGAFKTASLTAFVTIALVESRDIANVTQTTSSINSIDGAIQRATQYLEGQMEFLEDPYDIAISSYALLLAGSQKASEGIAKLEIDAAKPDCQDPSADIVFLLDRSKDIGGFGFQQITTFVKKMVQRLNIENNQAKVSMVTFGSKDSFEDTHEAFGLEDYHSSRDIIDAIGHEPFDNNGRSIADALRYVRKNSFVSNRNSSKLVILITYGNSDNRYATEREAKALKNAGVKIFSVGVGYRVDKSELQTIASGINHAIFVRDYSSLQEVYIPLSKGNCNLKAKMPWSSSIEYSPISSSFAYFPAHSLDIETASYMMLYYTKNKEYSKGQNILKWILKQRNVNGGFSSTQDTVLAIQAMSEFVRVTNGGMGSSQNVSIDVDADSESHHFNVNTGNRLVLQSFQPSNVPTQVNISATGQGTALVQVSVNYNVKEQFEKPVFTLNVTITNETLHAVTTKTCTSYNGTGVGSGMSIIEHGVLSGFEVDIEDVTANVYIKKIEIDDKRINIYLDEITTTPACVTVVAQRTTMVAKVKEAPVRVYDYYKPVHQVTAFYLPKTLKDSSYCDVCKECKCFDMGFTDCTCKGERIVRLSCKGREGISNKIPLQHQQQHTKTPDTKTQNTMRRKRKSSISSSSFDAV